MSKCPTCEEGLPEWIMSYADMITILMAFFVVMYSMAGSNKEPDTDREQAVLKSIRDRFGPNWLGMMGLWPQPSGKAAVGLTQMHNAGSGSKHNHKDVKRTKGRPTAGERPRSETQRQGKQAAIGGVLYFADGATQLTKAHEKQVQHAVEEIAGKPQRIEVRGHTARRPLTASGPPRDNWDLAYARCRTTMDQLVKGGIDPRRIRLGVAADNEPLNGGEDALSLSQSARVEIFLLDEFVDREEVEQAAPPRVAPAPAATP